MNDQITEKPKFNFNEFFNKNKIKIICTITIIISLIFFLIIFDAYKKKQNLDISEQFNKAKILIENNNNQEGLKILERIIAKKNSFYSPSALNLIVDKNLINDDTKILNYYDQIISSSNLDKETKNLFIFKKIIYIGDSIKESELLGSLKPILQSDSLWKNSVSDYIKKYYLSKGEFNKAKEFEISINK